MTLTELATAPAAPTAPAGGARARFDLLTRLYATEKADAPGYLKWHAQPATVHHHVNVFEWYAPLLKPGMAVLDWGCNHAPDACMVRHRLGEAVDLHACDFAPEHSFPVFSGYACPAYDQLNWDDPNRLPYPAGRFDVVIGSGVLEHVAMDGEALKEVYRVLRPRGLLVITFLPHAYSRDEWRQRRAGHGHRRLYTRSGLARLLLCHGFVPEFIGLQGRTVPDAVRTDVPPPVPRPPVPRPPRGFLRQIARPVLAPPWRLAQRQYVRFMHGVWGPAVRASYRLRRPPFFWREDVICALARKVEGM